MVKGHLEPERGGFPISIFNQDGTQGQEKFNVSITAGLSTEVSYRGRRVTYNVKELIEEALKIIDEEKKK